MSFELVNQRPAYYPHSVGIRFFAAAGTEIRLCVVSVDALQAYCGLCSSNPNDVVEFAETHRDFIEQIARRKYEAGNMEPEGSIAVRSVDFVT